MDREKTIEKGKRMLREYLNQSASETMATREKRRLFRLIEDEYLLCMDNEEYFSVIEAFVNRRKPKAEKEAFCKDMVTALVTSGHIRQKYAEKYPNDYTLPE